MGDGKHTNDTVVIDRGHLEDLEQQAVESSSAKIKMITGYADQAVAMLRSMANLQMQLAKAQALTNVCLLAKAIDIKADGSPDGGALMTTFEALISSLSAETRDQ